MVKSYIDNVVDNNLDSSIEVANITYNFTQEIFNTIKEMNFLEKTETIKVKLKEIGRSDLATKILELQLSGGTPGEVFISVCSELLKIKRDQKEVFGQIEIEAYEILTYAKSIGYLPS